MILNDEDAAALKEADDHLVSQIVSRGWEVIETGYAQSVIRGRQARAAVVRNGGLELEIVWDRGLHSFLTATDLEGTRWGIFDPALSLPHVSGAAMQILATPEVISAQQLGKHPDACEPPARVSVSDPVR